MTKKNQNKMPTLKELAQEATFQNTAEPSVLKDHTFAVVTRENQMPTTMHVQDQLETRKHNITVKNLKCEELEFGDKEASKEFIRNFHDEDQTQEFGNSETYDCSADFYGTRENLRKWLEEQFDDHDQIAKEIEPINKKQKTSN